MPDLSREVSVFSVWSRTFAAAAFLLLCFVSALGQNLAIDPAGKLLTDKIGDYRAGAPPQAKQTVLVEESITRNSITSGASRDYVSKDGRRFSVSLMTSASDSAAYAAFTEGRRAAESSGNEGGTADANVGTAAYYFWDGTQNDLVFFKGRANVYILDDGKSRDPAALMNFGQALADTLDKGAGEIPVLVKHLPDWQNVRLPLYIVSLDTLKERYGDASVFSVVSFEGGAEAVSANYGTQGLVIIEFNTPQAATEQSRKITAKIQELRSQALSAPSAYRRVGNYAVFVFDAPNEQAANQLIDQVKYQQVVQWLGENPFAYEQETREFTETTLGVLVAVVKTSGLALVGCLAVGGFFGALLFVRRRAQQRAIEAYVDGGAMLRLNIDELTPEKDPARLLES
jgi:hypothetical protein